MVTVSKWIRIFRGRQFERPCSFRLLFDNQLMSHWRRKKPSTFLHVLYLTNSDLLQCGQMPQNVWFVVLSRRYDRIVECGTSKEDNNWRGACSQGEETSIRRIIFITDANISPVYYFSWTSQLLALTHKVPGTLSSSSARSQIKVKQFCARNNKFIVFFSSTNIRHRIHQVSMT